MSGIKQNGDSVEINLFPKQLEFITSDCDDVLFGGSVGGGKLLHTQQLLPVTLETDSSGFKQMGDMQVNDFVLSPRGEPVRVAWISEIEVAAEAYEIEFDTGEKILADGRHLWKTMTAKERMSALRATPEWRERRRAKRPSRALLNPAKPGTQSAVIIANQARVYKYKPSPTGTVRTTREIFETQYHRERFNNHSIDVTKPVEFPEVDFRVDPYLIGIWLGDGSTNHGSFCKPVADMEEILSFLKRGFRTRLDDRPERNLPILVATPDGLTDSLRHLGVLGNKHIPAEYKRASVAQRIALLQGLCDTDGYCAEDGGIEIGFTNKQLIDDTFELATSLGIKAQVHEKRAMLNGEDYGPYWRMVFMAPFPCFRLKRKLNRQKMIGLRDTVRRRYIVSVKRVDPVPMRCIQVDHEDGMYLVGSSFIPTHNSYAVAIGALKRRLENPGTQGIIFRRTFPELEKSIIRETRKIYPMFGGKYNTTKHEWQFPNGSTQVFGYCEKDGDVYKHQGAEYADEWFDELTTFTEFQFKYLTSRLRSSDGTVKPIIRATANPGGVGHFFCYERYVLPSITSKKWYNEKEKKWMSFIPAKLADNPALALADPGYLDRLRVLSEKKYLALAEGRWDVFEGTYFENFDPRPGHGVLWNIRKPDTYTTKILGLDWGFSDPACVLWLEITPMGRIYVYRELYVNRLSPKELGKAILDLCPKDENYEYMVCPPEIFGKRVEYDGGGVPIADLIQETVKDRLILKSANNARVPGWLKVREYLFRAPGDNLPWMQISPNCTNLIRTMPAAIHSDKPNKIEDIDDSCEDHAIDALRYSLVSLSELPKHIITPYESAYDRIFGIQRDNPNGDQAPLPNNRGGY